MQANSNDTFQLGLCLSDCQIEGPPGASIEAARAAIQNAKFDLEIELAFDLQAKLTNATIRPAKRRSVKQEVASHWIGEFEWDVRLTLWDGVPPENVEFDAHDTCNHIQVHTELPDGWAMTSFCQENR